MKPDGFEICLAKAIAETKCRNKWYRVGLAGWLL